MKKALILFLFNSILSFGQTTISSPTVAGNWNLAGSPYIINVNIQVPSTQTLIVDPGVVVKFMPSTRLTVNGRLLSTGTSTAPIIYEAFDTTSWSNLAVPTGGWEGILYQVYSGAGTDNSAFNWCVVTDVKNKSMFECYRRLKISNCKFTHGNYFSDANSGMNSVTLATFSLNDSIIVDKCEFSNHISPGIGGFVLYNDNYSGGYTKISNSVIKDNNNGGAFQSTNGYLRFENNQLYNNTMGAAYGVCTILHGRAVINKNDIHNNVTGQYPAIAANGARVSIDNNFIHNNKSINVGICGSTSGGSGIHLSCGTMPTDSTFYLVRNNVVANNFRSTGSPIYIFNVRARISNNHVINNDYSYPNSQMLSATGIKNNLEIKNNIFYSISPSGVIDSVSVVEVLSGLSYRLENNYLPARFYKSVNIPGYGALVGDTTQNVIGTVPQMIAPTANNSYTTDASTANFNLILTSPCINKGDTTGCYTLATDFLGNSRMVGIIDIGAFEALSDPTGIGALNQNEGVYVYPNPASDKITVKAMGEIPGEISIIDILGREIYFTKSNELLTEINISDYREGLYILQLKQGNHSYSQKIFLNAH